jgi:hypothetical protein
LEDGVIDIHEISFVSLDARHHQKVCLAGLALSLIAQQHQRNLQCSDDLSTSRIIL